MDLPLIDLRQKLVVLVVGVAIVGVLAAGFFYFQYQKAQKEAQLAKNNSTTTQTPALEAQQILSEVAKLIELPSNEEPTIATVTDISKLKDQSFFANAKNGDKVLIYPNAKKAILYDPTSKKIINIAPINMASPSAQPNQPKILLRNGTQTNNLTSKLEDELKKTFKQLDVVGKENAARDDYQYTLVITLSSLGRTLADSLIKQLNASSSALPVLEDKPKDADILIIIGKDQESSF